MTKTYCSTLAAAATTAVAFSPSDIVALSLLSPRRLTPSSSSSSSSSSSIGILHRRGLFRRAPLPILRAIKDLESLIDEAEGEDGEGKSWPILPPTPPQSPPPISSNYRVDDKIAHASSTSSSSTQQRKKNFILDDILIPLLNPTIIRNIPSSTISGAAIHGFTLSLIASSLLFGPASLLSLATLTISASVAIFTSYVSITTGIAGDILRGLGRATVETTDIISTRMEELRISSGRLPSTEERAKIIEEKEEKKRMAAKKEEEEKKVLIAMEELAQTRVKAEEEAKTLARKAEEERLAQMMADQKAMKLAEEEAVAAAIAAAAAEMKAVEKMRIATEEVTAKAKVAEAKAIKAAEERRLAEEEAKAEADAEAKRVAEEMRLVAEEKAAAKVKEARIAMNLQLAEEEAQAKARSMKEETFQRSRLAAQIRQTELVRLVKFAAAEAEASRIVAEEMRVAEEAAQAIAAVEAKAVEEAEAARVAKEILLAEEASKAAAKFEMAKIAQEEEQRRLEEEAEAAREAVRVMDALMNDNDDDDIIFDDEISDEDWEASVRLANELQGIPSALLESIAGDVGDEIGDELLRNEFDSLSKEDEAALGRAAREAVRKYEEETKLKKVEKKSARAKWDDDIWDDEEPPQPTPLKGDSINNNALSGGSDMDYSKMTVPQLKELLKEKGLKVSGKKEELIARLKST